MTSIEDPSIIHVNDVLSFQIDGLGFIATPSVLEPLPESEESITQLRILKGISFDSLDYTRCAFRIQADSIQKSEILFGSVIQLIHIPSELYLVGTCETDNGYEEDERKPNNVYLRQDLGDSISVAHKWIVQPRYKMRNEGDPVRVNDYIILRNAQYKHLVIGSFPVADEAYDHLVALDSATNSTNKSGIKVIRILSVRTLTEKHDDKDSTQDSDYLGGCDFIRISHREYGGHILARLNDEKEISSVVTPFGSVSRKSAAPKDHSIAVVVRPFHMQQPKKQYDFATAFSCLGIWQILLVNPYSDSALQGKVRKGSRVRLRNLVTGQYLAIRPALHADIDLLIHKAKKKGGGTRRDFSTSRDDRESAASPRAAGKRKGPVHLAPEAVNEDEDMVDVESIKFVDDDAAPETKAAIHFKVTLLQAVVPGLKKMEWLGKNNPYLQFTFSNRFKAQTEVIEHAQNEAVWELSRNYQGMHFECDDMGFVTQDLNVSLMNKHSLFRDSLVGQGTVSLESVRSITRKGTVELAIGLFNKRKRKIGVAKLTIEVERLSSSPSVDPTDPHEEKIVIDPDAPIQKSVSSDRYNNQSTPFNTPPPLKLNPTNPPEKNFEWIVATSAEPTEYTNFRIHALNKEHTANDSYIRYDDNIFFESTVFKHRFQLVSPASGRCVSKWWEYKEDARLEPKQVSVDYIVDSEVFLLEQATAAEVQDTLYACKILPLARAATVTLQLTPSVSLLYTPIFRHLKKYLYTLTLWSLGEIDHDGSLLIEQGKYPKQKAHGPSTMEGFDEVAAGEDDDDDEEEEGDDNNNPLGALTPLAMSFFQTRSEDEKQDDQMPAQDLSMYHSSPTNRNKLGNVAAAGNIDKSKFTSSSLFPWLGRKVGMDFFSEASEDSPLASFTEYVVDDMVEASAPTNPVIMRRQVILFDLKLMEQLMHFLTVFFILQRAISYTENADILIEYAGLPSLVQQCCHAVHLFLNATVHSNERNALRLLSIRGSLLSLISQKILGWNPPLEAIVKIAFESTKDVNASGSSGDDDQKRNAGNTNTEVTQPSRDRFKLEDVLVHSITSSDIRQILEQMNEMNHQGDPAANNLLSLLTLLCQAGKAKKYFQNILMRYMITCDPSITNFSPTSSFARKEKFSSQHDSILFQTAYQDGEWKVRFQSQFVLPPQEDRNEEAFTKELIEEGESLKLLFYYYNRAEIDNDVLDLEECFLLLEDLGFGGPFLYEEIGQLMGSNIWGFFHWWCYRSSFYYPSSSVAHSQISPIQAMKLIDPHVDDLLIMMEFNRRGVDRDSIMRSLRFQSIINSRIPGLALLFSERSDHQGGHQEVHSNHYWKRMKKAQGTLGIRIDPIRKMKTSKLKDKFGPQHQQWIGFAQALQHHFALKQWFRGSIKLLTAACEGQNTLAQRIISVLLPAECLLSIMLNGELTYHDKSMFCDLMTNLYIDHMFVFPTRCIPVRRSGLYCAVDEDIFNPAVSLGKVFNPLSRVCIAADFALDGSSLRNQLFEFMKHEAGYFLFYSTANDLMNYNRALLRLFRKLLYQGFFGELDFYFLDFMHDDQHDQTFYFPGAATATATIQYYTSGRRSQEAREEEYLRHPTNLKEFELLLMRKLTDVKDIHRNQEISSHNTSSNNTSDKEGGANSGKEGAESDEKGLELVALQEKNRARAEKGVTQKQKNRKKFVSIFDDLATFDRIFADVAYTSLVHNGISALGEFMDIRQMYRVQKLWNHIGDYASRFALFAYSNDLIQLDKLLDDKSLYAIFDHLITEQYDDQTFVDAIFCGILHPERSLIEECLHLLDRRLSLYRGIYDLLETAHFVAKSSHAIINRCINTYLLSLFELLVEVLESDNQRRIHSLQIIDFFIENILSLLLRSDLEKFENSLRADDRYNTHNNTTANTTTGGEGTIVQKPTYQRNKEENDSKTRFVRDRNKVIIYYLISNDIPCPVGEDDFFLLDLKSLMANTERYESLQEQYKTELISLKIKPNFCWLVDAKESILRFSKQILTLLPAYLLVTFTKHLDEVEADSFRIQDITWEDLSDNQQIIIDKAFTFLSYLWKDPQLTLPTEWFPGVTDLLLALYPDCNGATVFLNTILEHTTDSQIYLSMNIVDTMLKDLAMYPDSFALPIKFRIMLALIACRNKVFVQKGGILMIDHLHDYFMKKFRMLLNFLPSLASKSSNHIDAEDEAREREEASKSFNSLAFQILEPIYIFLSSPIWEHLEGVIPESYIHGLQLYCSPRFCESVLGNPQIHLIIKQYLILISLKLYSIDDFPLEELVLKELRSLRLFLHVMKDETRQKLDFSGIRAFYFQGILPYLNYRILETNILSPKIIYAFLQAELQGQKGKLLNKGLADDLIQRVCQCFEPTDIKHTNIGELPRPNSNSIEEKGSSYLPVEMVNATMIVLNCLSYHDARLFRQATMEEKKQLIWVAAAILLFLQSRSDFIFDREVGLVIDMKLYEKVRDRLRDVVEGLLLEFISNHAEDYLQTYYRDLLLGSFQRIIKDSFENTNDSKATISLHSILKQRKASRIPKSMKHLKRGLNISVSYNRKFLKHTALFRFLQSTLLDTVSFLNRGGMALFSDNISTQIMVSSKSFAKRFSSYSTFDLWLKGNGRYLSHIMMYLGDILHPKQYDYNFVHILSALLDHSIEEIQENPLYSTNYRLLLIQNEQKRLHEMQNALAALGCLEMTIKVFGRCYTVDVNSNYLWKYTPLMLKIASELIAWQNTRLQGSTIDLIENAIAIQKPPERYCLVGLQRLLRKAATDIVGSGAGNTSAATTSATGSSEVTVGPGAGSGLEVDDQEYIMTIIRTLVHFCSFAGALCSGDNSRSQRFLVGLTKSVDGSRLFVNLTHDACLVVNAVLVRFTEMITYIKNDNFVNRLAPFVYEAKDNAKRRFLAWHDGKNNIPLMLQLIYSLSIVFENCISLCSLDSVHAVLKALPKSPELLEFFGLLQLTTSTNMGSGSFPGFQHVITWKGGHPIDFYRTLIREMKNIEAFHTDPDFIDFALSYKKWMSRIPSSQLARGISAYFHKVFGVSYDLLMDCVKRNENSCLRLILSALEVAPRPDTVDFVVKFTDSILIQNLDSSFRKLVWTFLSNKDILTSTTVGYVSLIEAIGRVEKSTDELLTEWDSTFTGIGVTRPKSIYGSVELVDTSGRIRRLYFPIPSFVTQFWTYPEVQKTKEAVVYEVVRTSPEEKIGDFLEQMNRITVVMKRQERLSLLLTYPIHAIFGGKSIPGGKYLPKQNNLALFITIGLNSYYVYYNTHPFSLPSLSGNFLQIYDWDLRTMIVMIVQWVHFLLLGAYACRSVLNSDAADDLEMFAGEGLLMKTLSFLFTLPYALFLVLKSAFWPILMTVMSFWALFNGSYWLYVPCLFDIAFQYEIMNFLFQAISRNVLRVGATLLLAFLCLYFYSIIAYLYIGHQYKFNDHEGCIDPGSCFKLHLDYGLVNGPDWDMPGYIAPDFKLSFPYQRQASYVLGTLYSLSYVILINLVLQALISGLIIDTFSEMRQEREDTQEDIDTKCFICSIKRDEFEQRGISYVTHITEEHNMWHYLWFKLYLELKDPLGFSSTENFAFRNFKDKQTFIKMMPIKRSLTLEALVVKDETEVDKRALEMEELKKMIQKLQNSQSSLRERLDGIHNELARKESQSP